MFPEKLQSSKLHGLLFDGATFIGNLTLFGALPRLGDDVDPRLAGGLLLLAVFTQMAGAWLKRGALTQRWGNRRPVRALEKGFFDFLLFFHFILFSVITFFALGLLGIADMSSTAGFFRSELWLLAAFLVGGVTTSLVRRAGTGWDSGTVDLPAPPWQEIAADGLLWVSVSVVTRIFWDGLVLLVEPAAGVGISAQGIALLLALSFLYVFFYLPGRYLFLVEDARSPLTWLQMWAAMLPVVWLVVAG